MMARRTGCILQTPETIIMNKRTSLLSLLLLIVTASVSAQTLPAGPVSPPVGPLNLSLPKWALSEKATATGQEKTVDPETGQVEFSEVGSKKKEERSAPRLPYGAGFENRQQGMATGGGSRGGMGRRR
jgi:hypothetical protein